MTIELVTGTINFWTGVYYEPFAMELSSRGNNSGCRSRGDGREGGDNRSGKDGQTSQDHEPGEDPDKAMELKKQLRFYETALESYFIDNNKYPPHAADRAIKHGGKAMPENVPTFKRYEPDMAYSLTTPLSYLNEFPADPYAQDESPFAYVSFDIKWLLWSPGPDGKYDLDWTEFDAEATQQSPEFFARYSYDVTNGVNSTGDLWLSKGRVGSVTFP